MMNIQGKQALVLGLGESGLAMALWLARCGAAVRVADTRAAPERLAGVAPAPRGPAPRRGSWRRVGIDHPGLSTQLPRAAGHRGIPRRLRGAAGRIDLEHR